MLNFGDLFFVEDKEYVWLFSDGNKIYAAIILNAQVSNQVKAEESKDNRKGSSHKKIIYCYVELSTQEYSNCTANLIATQRDMPIGSTPIRPIGRRLNDDDLIEIKAEILDAPELFNESLVNHVTLVKLESTK